MSFMDLVIQLCLIAVLWTAVGLFMGVLLAAFVAVVAIAPIFIIGSVISDYLTQ